MAEGQLHAVESVVEGPPFREREEVGDDYAPAGGKKARRAEIRVGLHSVAVEEQHRRRGTDSLVRQRTSARVVRHLAVMSTGRRRGPISKNVGTFSNS